MRIEVKHDPKGIRYVRPYLGTNNVTGRPIRPYKRFPQARTDEEAEELARQWIARQYPAAAEGSTNLVGDLLAHYVQGMEESGSPKNTTETYRWLLRHTGGIASMQAQDVRPLHLERMYRQLMRPVAEGGAGLGNNTVILLHNFLSGAFGWMAHVGVIGANPVRDARKPSPVPREQTVFDEDFDRLVQVLKASMESDDAMEVETAFAALLALHAGLRVGEACALRKKDVQPALSRVMVRGTVVEKGGLHRQAHTKGKMSRAVSVSGEVVEAIRAHERVLQDRGLVRSGKSLLVTVDGGLMRPSRLSRSFREMCCERGMRGCYTFHSLRHTHATQLLMAGVDAKTVSERLGHAAVTTTLKEYAHVLPGRDARAAEVFSEIARGGGSW